MMMPNVQMPSFPNLAALRGLSGGGGPQMGGEFPVRHFPTPSPVMPPLQPIRGPFPIQSGGPTPPQTPFWQNPISVGPAQPMQMPNYGAQPNPVYYPGQPNQQMPQFSNPSQFANLAALLNLRQSPMMQQ